MTASELYSKLGLPKNLQRHMLQVAALGEYLAQNCSEDVMEYHIVSALLMHDLGNVLKFDFSSGLSLFDADEQNLEHWQKLQQDMAAKYGDDVHEATLKMAKEAGASPRAVTLILGMGRTGLQEAVEHDDWEQRICCYSDFRVSPDGYTSLGDRFDDIALRYTTRKIRPTKIQHVVQDKNLAFRLEQQLKSRVLVSLKDLPEAQLVARAVELADFKF